jgi:adenine phosphoribosyltransferase
MKRYLRSIDTATSGNRYDVTPIFANAENFSELVADLVRPFRDQRIEAVACIDALGFILGSAMALTLKAAVIPFRKAGKLPTDTVGRAFIDYTGQVKGLELRKGLLTEGERILLVDDWVETGTQVRAAVDLLEAEGAMIVGIAAIKMERNEGTNDIAARYPVHTVWAT